MKEGILQVIRRYEDGVGEEFLLNNHPVILKLYPDIAPQTIKSLIEELRQEGLLYTVEENKEFELQHGLTPFLVKAKPEI